MAQALIASPLGTIRLAANELGLAGIWFEGQAHHPGELAAPDEPEHPWLVAARQALAAYWQDARSPQLRSLLSPQALPDTLPLAPQGTEFQQAVWQVLRQIPPGATTSYGELARQIGRPRAVRAAAAAVGRNPISILVPCHRVLGQDGSLTGYAGGLARKQALLRREGAAFK